MDRRTLLAITLCFLIYVGWQKYYLEPRLHTQTQEQGAETSSRSGEIARSKATSETTLRLPPQSTAHHSHPSKKITLSTETGESLINEEGPFFSNWTLKGYKLGISQDAAAVDMHSVTHESGEVTLAFDDPNFSYLHDVQGKLERTAIGATWTYEDAQVKLSREFFSTDRQPYIDARVTAEFKNRTPKYAFLYINSQSLDKEPEAQDRQLVYWANESIERFPLHDKLEQRASSASVKYVAATNRYFIMALVAQAPLTPEALIQPTGPNAGRASLVYPITGKTMSLPVRVYFGPKELEILRRVEPTLDHTVDFGWFTICAYPLLKTLKWFYQFVQNYGLAIILLTLLLKVCTYPLTYKSMKSMKKMAKLQPQLQKLRERYKDDRETLNKEMLTMMRNNGYNPMAGCLPMIIQMPIFFALYRVLYSSIELYHAPFAFWIKDLSSHDPFYVTPILLSFTMFIQQKLTPNTATDPAQARMMQLMPLIFGAFMLALPAGLTIYMLVNALASIAQQMILNKKLDPLSSR